MPEWPKSGEQLKEAGYLYIEEGNCKGCGKPIVWAQTPKGNSMPLAKVADKVWQPHFIDCPKAKQFKKPAVGQKRTTAGKLQK